MSTRTNRRVKALIAGTASAAAIIGTGAFGVAAANADPTSSPRTYVAVGSDTIQSIYDGFTNGYTIGLTSHTAVAPNVASYDATGTSPLTGIKTGAVPLTRPNGSGAGRAALSAAWSPISSDWSGQVDSGLADIHFVTPGSVDIARSSGKPNAAHTTGVTVGDINGSDNLTSIPLARDAVDVVTKNISGPNQTAVNTALDVDSVPGFSTVQLQAIWGEGLDPDVAGGNYIQSGIPGIFTVGDIVRGNGGNDEPSLVTDVDENGDITGSVTFHVYLPQSQSGTRQFFLGALGDSGNTASSWVDASVEENTASDLAATNAIAPFSVGQDIAQTDGAATDTGVSALTLYNLNGLAPLSSGAPGALYGSTSTPPAGGTGVFSRDVYSVIRSKAAESLGGTNPAFDSTLTTLVSSTLPGDATAIGDYGFLTIGYSATTADWIHSSWEN